MILGNQTWQSGLNSPQKQPLYILQIPQFGIVLASFTSFSDPAASRVGIRSDHVGSWRVGNVKEE